MNNTATLRYRIPYLAGVTKLAVNNWTLQLFSSFKNHFYNKTQTRVQILEQLLCQNCFLKWLDVLIYKASAITFFWQTFGMGGGGGDNIFFFSWYYIQHCFICRPAVSTVPTDAGIEPRTVATGALAVRRSKLQARSHPGDKISYQKEFVIK